MKNCTINKKSFYIITALLIFVFIIICLELFCRIFSPIYLTPEDYFDNFVVADNELGYKLKDNFRSFFWQDYNLYYTTNSFGLRDRDFSFFPTKGVKRILAIGDSWTFGPGVELEDTWPKQLEKILRAKGIECEVINAGVNGYSTRNYSRVLHKYYNIYHPQVVVVLVYSNDPAGDIADTNGIYPTLTLNDNPVKKFLKRHSHLAKNIYFIYQRFLPKKYGLFYIEKFQEMPEDDPEVILGYQLYRETLIEMKKFCRKNNILLIVAALDRVSPSSFQMHTKVICEDAGIDDYIPLEITTESQGLRGLNSAGHFNPEGYLLLASSIGDYIYYEVAK